MQSIEARADYFATARVLFQHATLEDERRKVKYLNPFAEAPTVAEQVSGVLVIGRALSAIANQSEQRINPHTVDGLLLWHDDPEERYGDLGRDQKRYAVLNEDRARQDIFGEVPWGQGVIHQIETFESGSDPHVKLARDADALYVIYTIKSLLDQGFAINKPEERIKNTLKRITTDEGIALGQEMANHTPDDIWQSLTSYAGLDREKFSPPPQSLGTIMATGWALTELANANGKKLNRDEITDILLRQEEVQTDTFAGRLVEESRAIYDIIHLKRELLKRLQDRSTGLSDDQIKAQIDQILKDRFNTDEGTILGQVVAEMDPFEWWQIMMGYAAVQPDGKATMKPR